MCRIFKLIVDGGIPWQRNFKVKYFITALADKESYEKILEETLNISSVAPPKTPEG
jgi:hypothetical protein